MEALKEIIDIIIVTLLTGCGVIVVKKLFGIFNAMIDDLQVSTKLSEYEQLNKYIDNAQQAILTAVTTVTQTYVDNIKGTDEWNDEAKANAKAQAIDIAAKLINDDMKIAINTVFGDFETFLCSTIETICKQEK